MGIYDRDYYRQERSDPPFPYIPRTIVGWIIVVNVAVWLADFISPATAVARNGDVVARWLSDQMAVHVDTLMRPWLWWQYLTAGFAHAPGRIDHILFNMLALFFLGREVERLYGPKEFLRLYLAMIVFANFVWNVVNAIAHAPPEIGAYGASGAITGVVLLFALNFPRVTILLFFVLPVPAWVLGALVVVGDLWGAVSREPSNIAYSVHLAGAAFAFAYFRRGWNLTRLTDRLWTWPKLRRRPPLRIHRPEEPTHPDLSAEVDRILEKIYQEGESSLTANERKILETASRQYQQRRVTRDQ